MTHISYVGVYCSVVQRTDYMLRAMLSPVFFLRVSSVANNSLLLADMSTQQIHCFLSTSAHHFSTTAPKNYYTVRPLHEGIMKSSQNIIVYPGDCIPLSFCN